MRTRSIEEVRDTLARIYARPVLTPTHGARVLDATMNYCAMSDLRLYYRAYGADVRLEFPETGYLLQLVPLRGSGELTIGKTTMAMAPGVDRDDFGRRELAAAMLGGLRAPRRQDRSRCVDAEARVHDRRVHRRAVDHGAAARPRKRDGEAAAAIHQFAGQHGEHRGSRCAAAGLVDGADRAALDVDAAVLQRAQLQSLPGSRICRRSPRWRCAWRRTTSRRTGASRSPCRSSRR